MKTKKISSDLICNLVEILGKFKELKRRGWIKRKVKAHKRESDSEHSFDLSLLVLRFAPDNLDRGKCLALATIHDIPEIHSKDYTPGEIHLSEKHRLEKKAAKQIAQELEMPEFLELFDEFIAQKTPESRFVLALDKLSCALTAKYYDDNGYAPTKLSPEFASFAKLKIDEIDSEDLGDIKQIINYLNNQGAK